MRRINTKTEEPRLRLEDAFAALRVLSESRLISGLDVWRHETGKDYLGTFNPDYAQLIQKQPPTKYGHADKPSLWTSTHFMLALPCLSYAIRKYGKEDPLTSTRLFSETEMSRYFLAFPFIARHFREYKIFVSKFGKPTDEWWDKTLGKAFADVSAHRSLSRILEQLPPYLKMKANLVLSDSEDSFVGRIVLSYLLDKRISPEALRIDRRALRYLGPINDHTAKNLYERMKHAQQELQELEPYLDGYDSTIGLELGKLLSVVQWYARPHLVEMVIPGQIGAAEPVIKALIALFDKIVKEGGPDYTAATLGELPSSTRFKETQDLAEIGRLSLIKDILSTDANTGTPDGAILRRLACELYSTEERFAAWGNASYYVPDTRTTRVPFSRFRQDIADVLYGAALVVETDALTELPDPDDLKSLALDVTRVRSLSQLRKKIGVNARLLSDLATDWEERYPGHERLRILRFIQFTFGLIPLRQVPVPFEELNKSFAGSSYDGSTYYLSYQEAGETITVQILLPKIGSLGKDSWRVSYHLLESTDSNVPITGDGLPYSAWLECAGPRNTVIVPVPSRGSYDPFGRPESSHAGEVVGFGCSIHHAALVLVLAELAALGAKEADLKKVKKAFLQINRENHARIDLADYQLAQVLAAFRTGRQLTISEYVAGREDITRDKSRPHAAAYLKPGQKPLAWAEPQAARLAFGYPEFYPYENSSRVNPRSVWYDGEPFIIESPAGVTWRVLTSYRR